MAKPTIAYHRSPMDAVLAILLCLALSLALGACGGGNNNRFNPGEVGSFRAINAVSDSPNITFFLEGNNLGNVAFGQASGFQLFSDGRFDVNALYNTLDNQSVTLLEDEEVRIRIAEQTTLVLAGTVAAPVVLQIEAADPDIVTTEAEFQLLNTAGAGSLDLYLTEVDAPLGAPLTSVAANTVSPVLPFAAGQFRARLTATGSNTVVFDSGPFTLPGGQRIVFHAKPYFGFAAAGTNPGDMAVIDAGRTSNFPAVELPVSVRIANAIADPPAADVAIENAGTTTSLNGVAANSFSDAVELVPGPVDINVTMETDPATQFVNTTAELSGGERRTLIAAGSFSDGTTTGRLALDPVRPISSAAQINFMHGSASAGRVDVYLLTDDATTATTGAAVPGLALLANSNLDVLAGTYSLVFTRAGDDAELAGPLSITVNNNQLYSILLTDAEGGGTPPQIIQGSNFE